MPRSQTPLLLLLGVSATLMACVDPIEPGQLPQVSYTAPINAYANQTVIFDASASSDPEGPLAAYGFDFGDGTPALRITEPIVTHTYSRPGRYLTRVTVIDVVGNKFTELREISIVSRDQLDFLVCSAERPYCPPFYLCDPMAQRCQTDIDGDGIATAEDEDEPGCTDDAQCPGDLICRESLCQ